MVLVFFPLLREGVDENQAMLKNESKAHNYMTSRRKFVACFYFNFLLKLIFTLLFLRKLTYRLIYMYQMCSFKRLNGGFEYGVIF